MHCVLRRSILCFMLLFAACGGCANVDKPLRPVRKAPSLHSLKDISIEMKIAVIYNDGGVSRGTGSGVLLDEYHVLTAAHVIVNFQSARKEKDVKLILGPFVVDHKGEEAVEYDVVKMDITRDLALIRLIKPIKRARYAELGIATPKLGDTILYFGVDANSKDVDLRISTVAREDSPGIPYHFRISEVMVPGNSGGPAFDKDGFLVGIMTRYAMMPAHGHLITSGLSLAVNLQTIRLFLKDYLRRKALRDGHKKSKQARLVRDYGDLRRRT